jgi:hypothetical protein
MTFLRSVPASILYPVAILSTGSLYFRLFLMRFEEIEQEDVQTQLVSLPSQTYSYMYVESKNTKAGSEFWAIASS